MENKDDFKKVINDFINSFPSESRFSVALALYFAFNKGMEIVLSNYHEMKIKGFEINGKLEEDILTVKKYKEYLQNGGEINE